MPKEHILANLRTVLLDVVSHRPADMGTSTLSCYYKNQLPASPNSSQPLPD